jgi:hypothetical protein
MSNVDERSRSHVFRIPISWFAPGRDLVAVRVRADSAAKLGMLWDYLMKDGIEILGTMLNTIPGGSWRSRSWTSPRWAGTRRW